MAKNTKNEVAKVENFALVSMKDGIDEETRAALEDEMEDLEGDGGIYCRRIKLPSGGGKAFEIEGDDPDDPEIAKEFNGVVLFTHKINTMWEGEYGGENKIPVCSSFDAKNGTRFDTGEVCSCDKCPHNQFKEDNSGKDCKNMRRIYLMLDGQQWLYLLTVPPTSLKSVTKQLNTILAQGVPFTDTVLNFTLESATSRKGNDFSKIVLKRSSMLSDDQKKMARAMREEIKKQYQNVGVSDDDYATPETDAGVQGAAPKTDADGFANVPEGIDGELPFN